MQFTASYVLQLRHREQQRRRNRINPTIRYSACASHHPDSREMPAVSRSLEKDCRSLAHQGPDPRYTSRLDQRSTSVHKTFRFSKKLDWQAHRSGSLQKDPPTLSRHRINPSTPGSIRHKRSVVSLLPSTEEGHRQDEGMHRSQHHQPVPPVRALQDGGPSHHSGSAPQEGSHVEDRHVRLLHASADRGGGPLVLPVSVRRNQIRMFGNAIRARASSSYRNKVLATGYSISPPTAGPMYGLHRRCDRDGSQQAQGHQGCPAHSQSADQAGLHHSSREDPGQPDPVNRSFGHSSKQCKDAVSGPKGQEKDSASQML